MPNATFKPPVSLVGPVGPDGLSVLSGEGPPPSNLGVSGQPGYIDTQALMFYGPKTDQGWPSSGQALQGNDATLPADMMANSLVLAPASGDSKPSQILLNNSSGTQVFGVDGSGDTTVAGTLTVTGQTTANTLNAGQFEANQATVQSNASVGGTLSVSGESDLGVVKSGALTAASVTTPGAVQAASVTAASLTTTGALNAGSADFSGKLQAQDLTVQTLEVSDQATLPTTTLKGDATFQGNITASQGTLTARNVQALSIETTGDVEIGGDFKAEAMDAASLLLQQPSSNPAAYPLEVLDGNSNDLFSIDSQGNASILGTLQVHGAQTSSATNAGALTATSFVDQGNAEIEGSLKVDGQATFAQVQTGDLTANSVTTGNGTLSGALAVTGTASLGSVSAKDLTITSLKDTGAADIKGALTVEGSTTLASLSAQDVSSQTLETAHSAQIGGNLSVAGSTTVNGLTAAATSVGTLTASGNTQVSGTLQSGPLAVIMPANASADPLTVTSSSGSSLLDLNAQGNLTVAGSLTVNGSQTNNATNAGALTASSFLDTGNAEIQGTLKVDKATTLLSTSTADLSATTLTTSGAATIGGPATLSSSASISGALSSASVSTGGVTVNTDQYGNGGTLKVQGQANLSTTVTADLHPSSVQTSGSESVGGNLSVSGASTLASLTVSGGSSLGGTSTAALSATTLSVSGNGTVSGALSSGNLSAPQLAIAQTQAGHPLTVVDPSAKSLMDLDGSGNLVLAGTLSVGGQPAGSASNLGAITVSSFSDTGNASITGTLQVNGATTLAALTASGQTTLGPTQTGALNATSSSISGNETVGGTFGVSGATTLGQTTTAALTSSSVTSSGPVQVSGNLGVTGTTTVGGLTAAATKASSLQVTGNETVGGTLQVTGATTLGANLGVTGNTTLGGTVIGSGSANFPALGISLPSSNASSTPFTGVDSTGKSLWSFDNAGNATFAGAITAAGGQSSTGPTNAGALTASSITDTGTLSVSGATTLAAVTVSSLTNSGASQAASLALQLPSSGAAAKPLNLLSSGSSSLFSVDSSGNGLFAGTLGVTGATSLSSASVSGTLSAGASTLSSLTVNNAASISGNLSVGGAVGATRFYTNSAGSASAPMLGYTPTGSQTNYVSGLYSEPNFGQWYETVGNAIARSITFVGTNPGNSTPTFYTHSFYSGVSGAGNTAHRFYVNGSTLAFAINGSGNASLTSTLNIAGLTTAAGVTLSSGALTFADGTSLTTATAINQATYTATSAGAAATPAFRFSGGTNPAGMYFDTAPGNVYLSVNGYKSLYSTAASGAAQGANGWAIASTLGSGSSLLALYGGGSTSTPVYAVDGAGAVTAASQSLTGASSAASYTASGTISAANLTISTTGGKLTFGDGTTMTTAATGGSSSSGSASQFVATSQGTVSAPAYTQTSNSNTGTYFTGSGSTSALQVAANGVNVAQFNSTGLTLPSGSGTKITFADGTVQASAATGTASYMGVGCGPGAFVSTPTTLTSTPTVMFQPNSNSVQSTYVAGANNFFVGAILSSPTGGATFELYDQTAGTSLYKSSAVGANSSAVVGQFNNFAYPMTAGHTYVWRVTGSASFTGSVNPQYYMALTGLAPSGGAISTYATFQHIGSLSATPVAMGALGDNLLLSYVSPRASVLYNVTVSSASSNTGTATFTLYNASAASNVASIQDITGATLSLAPGQSLTTPYLGTSLPASTYYSWRVTGSGSGTYTLIMQVAE